MMDPETEFHRAWAIGYRWGKGRPSLLEMSVPDLLRELADFIDREGGLEKESEQFGWVLGAIAGIQDGAPAAEE